LARHLSVDELEQRYRAAHEPHERTWWQIRWLLSRGQTAIAIAESTESTGYTASWIGQIAQRYNAEGPAGRVTRHHTTSWRVPRMLSAAQHEELRQALTGKAPDGSKHGTCRAVADWMAAKLGRPVHVQRGWDYRRRRKQRRQVPRPQHALADAAAQETCERTAARS
jgi:hypothetical protein